MFTNGKHIHMAMFVSNMHTIQTHYSTDSEVVRGQLVLYSRWQRALFSDVCVEPASVKESMYCWCTDISS